MLPDARETFEALIVEFLCCELTASPANRGAWLDKCLPMAEVFPPDQEITK
jgi:hypothetical protein